MYVTKCYSIPWQKIKLDKPMLGTSANRSIIGFKGTFLTAQSTL